MTRLALAFPLLVTILGPRPAGAEEPLAAVLPATGEGVDSVTLSIVTSTLNDKLGKLGFSAVSEQTVSSAASLKCSSADCSTPADAIAVGKAVGADQVVSAHLAKDGDEVVIQILAFDVAAGTNEQAAAKTAPSGVLSKVVKLLSIVLPEPAGPAPVPDPEPGPGPPEPVEGEPEPPDVTPVVPPGEDPGEETGPAPIPPGGDGEEDGEEEDEQEEDEEEDKPKVEKDQSGRLELSLSATMYAMMMTFTIMYAAEVREWYWYPPALLLGGGTALAASLLITWKLKVTSGDAAMFDACLGWGIANGTLIAFAAGHVDYKPALIGVAVGGGVGLVGGILVAALSDPSRGDAGLMSTFANWGTMLSVGLAWLAMPDLPGRVEHWMIAALVGMDLGIAGGLVASFFLEVSPRRLGFINLAGYLGGLVGATVGLPVLLVPKHIEDKHWKGYGAMVVSFSALGLVLGSILTKKLDEKKVEKGLSPLPFLLAHDEAGWALGIPSISPLPGPDGTGIVRGAQLSLAGGYF